MDAIKLLVKNLETTFEALTFTYIQNDTEYVYSVYKQQTTEIYSKRVASTSTIRILHQLQLGIMDALIEHSYFTLQFK